MRKLKLQMQMTLDGFIAGPNGEMDWTTYAWDDALNAYVAALTEPIDCILLGRKLAEGFIPYWASVAADPDNPQIAAGQKFTTTPKVVFTRTLTASAWENTVLAESELVEEIARLKAQPGGDIIAYGGATFVADLVRHELVDEYNLFINPAAIGHGLSIFEQLAGPLPLRLISAVAFDCGIVALRFEPQP